MRTRSLFLYAAIVGLSNYRVGQAQDPSADLQQKIVSQFPLTKFTADKTDIVTAGSVMVLQKDGLVMYAASLAAPPIDTYKNGKFNMGFGDTLKVDMLNGQNHSQVAKKVLVTGQKVWLRSISVQKDKAAFEVLTDPYDDGRYFAVIKVDFPKNSPPPSADDLLKTVSEFMTLDGPPPAATAAAPPPQPVPAMAPIPPPPPPPDEPAAAPKTISLGEKRDDVIAAIGQPSKTVKLGTKEILYFPDMKITMVNGKVSDVQ